MSIDYLQNFIDYYFMSKKANNRSNRKLWFRILCTFLKLFVHKKEYIFLGDNPNDSQPFILFTNHVGSNGPISHELYAPFKFRFWGTYEMTDKLSVCYKYFTEIYLHNKKKMNLGLAKFLGALAIPFVRIFYRGMKLIPTYTDVNLMKSISLSMKSLSTGENLIIFPEDSHDGYHDHLTGYFGGGFLAADRYCKKFNKDIVLYNAYLIKKQNIVVVDKGIPFSQLKATYGNDFQAMADEFCRRANELGDLYRNKTK